jgi:hypothetical protein
MGIHVPINFSRHQATLERCPMVKTRALDMSYSWLVLIALRLRPIGHVVPLSVKYVCKRTSRGSPWTMVMRPDIVTQESLV